MVVRHRYSLLAVIMLVSASAVAAPSVTANVRSTNVTAGAVFLLELVISGGDYSDPEIPQLSGLTIEGPFGTSSNTSISMGMGKKIFEQTTTLSYQVVASQKGKFTIPRIGVNIDGKKVYTKPIILNVTNDPQPITQGNTRSRTGRQSSRNRSTGTRSRTGKDPTWDEAGYAKMIVNKTEVYEGEPIYLTLQVWTIRGYGISVEMGLPAIEGFYAVPEKPESSGRGRKTQDGMNYDIEEYKQVLFPMNAGEAIIGEWKGRIGKRGFFGMDSARILSAPAIPITIKPLPTAPKAFTGAVGNFDFEVELTKDEVLQGVPTQLILSVSGQGNPDAMSAPKLPKLEGTYTPDPEVYTPPSSNVDNVIMEKTFTYSITPLEAGDLIIPDVEFCYFNPDTEQYVSKKKGPFTIRVLAAVASDRHIVFPEDVDLTQGVVNVLTEDILPITDRINELRPDHSSSLALPVIYVAPVFAYAGLAFVMRRKRRFERDTGLARSHGAKSKFQKRLAGIAEVPEPTDELYKALTGFLADKLNLTEAGLTSTDVREHLTKARVDKEVVDSIVKILKACERARYGSAGLSQNEVQALVSAAMSSMAIIEKEFSSIIRQKAGRGDSK